MSMFKMKYDPEKFARLRKKHEEWVKKTRSKVQEALFKVFGNERGDSQYGN